jgi:hypothetical protein
VLIASPPEMLKRRTAVVEKSIDQQNNYGTRYALLPEPGDSRNSEVQSRKK